MPCRPKRHRQHRVDVHHPGAAVPGGNDPHTDAFQRRVLVFGGLPYPAFADQRQRTAVNMYRAHGAHLQRPSKFCATMVSPRLYRAMDIGLHSRMMAVYSRQPMRVVPAKKHR